MGFWVVDWQVVEDDFVVGVGEFDDFFGELEDCYFVWVVDVYWFVDVVVEQVLDVFDQIVDVVEGVCLVVVVEDGDWFVVQCLVDEGWYDVFVVWLYMGFEGVEDVYDVGVEVVVVVVCYDYCFGEVFGFVVYVVWIDWVDVVLVVFWLWMNQWIVVDF